MNAIKQAAEILGSNVELAKKLNVHPSMISQMINGVRKVPPAKCRIIESATDGQVSCGDLRPDIFGPTDNVA